jgi:hypothetical protein
MNAQEAREISSKFCSMDKKSAVDKLVAEMDSQISSAAKLGKNSCCRPRFRDGMLQETLEKVSRILTDRGFITSICNGELRVEW